MFICMHCGHEFEEPQKDYDRGTGHMDECCPNCGSEDFEEAAECEICGTTHSVDALENGVCKDCLEKRATLENAYAYGEKYRTSIEINGLLAYAFDAKEIEGFLRMVLRESRYKDRDARNFCMDDPYEFAKFIKEEDK